MSVDSVKKNNEDRTLSIVIMDGCTPQSGFL